MKKQLVLGLVLMSGVGFLNGEIPWWKRTTKPNPNFHTTTVYYEGIKSKKDSSVCGSVCKKTKGFPFSMSWFPKGGWKWSKSKGKFVSLNNGKPSGCVCASAQHDFIFTD
jgi:hypothetical protein